MDNIVHGIKVDFSRDNLFDDLGVKRLKESYMREDEKSPQERFAYVSASFGSNPEHSQRLYNYSSMHWLSYSTPILSYGRSKRGLPISCFLPYLDDSAEGLVDTALCHLPFSLKSFVISFYGVLAIFVIL